MLAREVSYLNFRYYKVEKLSKEEQEAQGEDAQYTGTWVENISLKPVEGEEDTAGKETKQSQKDSISMPRAVEISLGVYVSLKPGQEVEDEDERELVYLPPMIVPLNTGIEFIRTTLEENEETDDSA